MKLFQKTSIKYQQASNWLTNKMAVWVGCIANWFLLLQAYLASRHAPKPTVGWGGQVQRIRGKEEISSAEVAARLLASEKNARTEARREREEEEARLTAGGAVKEPDFLPALLEATKKELDVPDLTSEATEEAVTVDLSNRADVESVIASLKDVLASMKNVVEDEEPIWEDELRPPTKKEIDELVSLSPVPGRRAKRKYVRKQKVKKAK